MSPEQTTTRLPKAVVGDVKAVATLLSSDVASVFREFETGKLPAPLIVCGQTVWRLAEIREWVLAGCPDRATWERRTISERALPAKRKTAREAQPVQPQYDNFKIPKPGKGVFAWSKQMEKVFRTKLVEGMARDGRELGCGDRFAEWEEEHVQRISLKVISYIRTLPTYAGQFDYLFAVERTTPPWEDVNALTTCPEASTDEHTLSP